MSSVTLRVLIAKKELDELKAIALYHEKHCKVRHDSGTITSVSDATVKHGAGTTGPDGDKVVDMLPSILNTEQNIDARNGEIADKDILLQGATTVSLPENKLEETSNENLAISMEDIVSSVRKRFQKKALKLLRDIAKIPNALSYDNHGAVTINGFYVENSDIKDLIASCFYSIRSKNVVGLVLFIQMLKDNQLFGSVSNPELHQENFDKEWYFIGDLT